jgi:hypothetical protein
MKDEDDTYPIWARILIAVMMLAGGAGFGALIGQSWGGTLVGLAIATPLAALGFFSPGGLCALFLVLELFSCLG